MSEQTEAPGKLRRAFLLAAGFVLVLWALVAAQALTGVSLVRLGVYPQRLAGLAGVLSAPLVHGSWTHLFANTGPLLVLGTALLYGYPRSSRILLPALYLGTGLAVWTFARPAYHIGASGLTSGMLFFLFTVGVLRWDRRAIAIAMIVSFLYGSMVWGLLPHDPTTSHETHLAAAAIGLVLAFVLRRRDPPPPRRRYDWEDEDEDESDEGDEEDEDDTPWPPAPPPSRFGPH